jgi:hypothetical protein
MQPSLDRDGSGHRAKIAGYRGKPFVRSVRVQDPLAWSLGYIEGTGWRGRV